MSSEQAVALPVEDLFVETPRGPLFARAWGGSRARAEDRTIVLLHDSLGCVELWRDFPEKLAQASGLAVVAYDRLGFGRSALHPGKLSFDFIREEAAGGLAAVTTHLGLKDHILFGHSVGGAMAVAAAAASDGRCRAVITESAQAFVEDRTLAGIRQAKAAFAAPEQVERLARYHGPKAQWVLDAWTETWLAPRFADWSLDDDLRAVTCPVLAMHGDLDEFGSTAFPERIAGLPHAMTQMTVFETCGHVPHRERPEAVLRTVTSFLAEARAEERPARSADEGGTPS
ncbi:alpha/beta fold hydrolase [Caulobacter soli]|uniref:alpha/beta fold hydrolase n=1 Tax=Caulobacter soli TaxID=2708539 RepID=UPI0013EAAF11|nr:alpha/beta hydrolase [Caulobacter soli]